MSIINDSTVFNNGIKMPVFGLGTWKSKVGEVKQAVKTAINCGYRHIDCAYGYRNEDEVGDAIKECIEEGIIKREDIFVTSKLWNTRHLANDVKPSLQESLASLKLDYLDLYLVHWPHAFKPGKEFFPRDEEGNVLYADIPLLETWKALEKCVDEGLVKSIGCSNYNSLQMQEILNNSRIKPVTNQVEIHPYFNNDKLVKFCQSRGVVMTAYSPFGSPDRPWATPDSPQLLDDPELKKIADKYGKSPAQVVLRWLVQRDIAVIPKSVTPARIEANIQVGDFQLSSEDMSVINGFDKGVRILAPTVVRDGKTVYRDQAAPNYPFQPDVEF